MLICVNKRMNQAKLVSIYVLMHECICKYYTQTYTQSHKLIYIYISLVNLLSLCVYGIARYINLKFLFLANF